MKELRFYSTGTASSIASFINKNKIDKEDIQCILSDNFTLTYLLYYWAK